MRSKSLFSTLIIMLCLSAESGAALAGDAPTAKAAIVKAEEAKKMAASVDSEWRDTGKILKKAKAAFEEGDYALAVKLAGQAEEQGLLGYEQGASQKELRIPSYLKY